MAAMLARWQAAVQAAGVMRRRLNQKETAPTEVGAVSIPRR
jgi:hypothetical protein